MRTTFLGITMAVLLVGCGGDSSPPVTPDTDEFDISPQVQQAIDQAAAQGDAAEGTYTFDEPTGSLTFSFTASTFDCNIETGTMEVEVTELTATSMTWRMEDGASVGWLRADNSTAISIVGIWRQTEVELYLVISASGTVQLFGSFGEECTPEREQNGNGCYRVEPSTAAITIDGDLSDWSTVGATSSLTDSAGDYDGADPGADIRATKVAYGNAALYVLLQLHGAPSTDFQGAGPPYAGAYRLEVRGSNGLSQVDRVYYDTNTSSWILAGDGGSTITAAAGADGIEFRVDLAAYDGQQGFDSIDLILAQAVDCSGSCVSLDDADCAFVAVP